MKWSRIAPLRRPTKPKSDALRRAGARIRTHVGSRPALVRPAPTRQTDTKVRLNFLYPQEAVIIDLQQAELSIAKVIHPKRLPPAVFEYLNPRTRISYYFEQAKP